MDSSGDYTFGQSAANYLVDSPEAVGQRVGTRLRLWVGDWFLDLTEGTPYWEQILGHKNIALAGAVLRDRILSTPFAVSVDDYSVIFDETTRDFKVVGKLNTAFGRVSFSFPTRPGLGGTFTLDDTPLGGGPLGG